MGLVEVQKLNVDVQLTCWKSCRGFWAFTNQAHVPLTCLDSVCMCARDVTPRLQYKHHSQSFDTFSRCGGLGKIA